MPMTLTALRTEINTDPKGLGYNTLWAQDNGPEAVADKLNQPGASSETLFRTYVPIEDVLAEIVLTEFNALTAAQKTAVDQYLREERIKTGSANMRTALGTLFPNPSATRTALLALAQRPASRAEALWGEGVQITPTNVADAMAL